MRLRNFYLRAAKLEEDARRLKILPYAMIVKTGKVDDDLKSRVEHVAEELVKAGKLRSDAVVYVDWED